MSQCIQRGRQGSATATSSEKPVCRSALLATGLNFLVGIAAVLMAIQMLFTGLRADRRQGDQGHQGSQSSGSDQS